MLRILVCNDDGYLAPGILALHEALAALPDVQVDVIAPEHNNSAKSNALTLHAPLYVRDGHNGFRYVNGTPADCVHIALTGLLDYRPDLVVSGINNGANMGDDTIYSGTVGAAMEGYLFGIPALAFSLVERDWAYLDAAARASALLVAQIAQQGLHRQGRWLLNVNIPNLPLTLLKPVRWCRLGRRHAAERVICQQNPRGETMYWIGSAGAADDASPGTDFDAVAQGHVAVTPLHVDLTDHASLDRWRDTMMLQRFIGDAAESPVRQASDLGSTSVPLP